MDKNMQSTTGFALNQNEEKRRRKKIHVNHKQACHWLQILKLSRKGSHAYVVTSTLQKTRQMILAFRGPGNEQRDTL